VIGMLALGTEITLVLYKQRQMQSVADAAALGGATALSTGYPADLTLEARAIAASLGFVGGSGGTTVVINHPPASGPHASDDKAVEAIIRQPQTLTMVGLFSAPLFNIGARAVATAGSSGKGFCVLQTIANSVTGVTFNNGANVNLDGCGLAANSTGTSLLVSNGSTMNTQSVYVSGSVQTSGGGVINSTDPIETHQPATPDPYASVPMPTWSGCDYTNKNYGHGNHTLTPGTVYCGNLTFSSDAIVTMNPGVYIVVGTDPAHRTLTFGDNVRVTGTGVTIFLTQRLGNDDDYYARVVATNSARVTLRAPTDGATKDIVFFGDRKAPRSTSNSFEGNAEVNITGRGAFYFPSQTVTFTNSAHGTSDCSRLLAATIRILATTWWFRINDCIANGGGSSNTRLVE